MRKVLLALALLGVATSAWADPADLTGGVFIAHYEAQVQYCIDPTDYCALYAPYAISDPSQAVVQLPDDTEAIWYVLAAWELEAKTWCGTEFGFGDYAGLAFTYYSIAPCYPPTGGLEIPSTGWPGPLSGTAFVATGDPWNGNYLPVYWFAGKAYEYYGPTTIQIDLNPHPPTSFCGFSNCMNPPASFSVAEAQRGSIGIGVAGRPPMFPPPPEPWACCIPVEPWCVMLMEQECLLAGGEWLGPQYVCEPGLCPEMWACCVGGVCTMMFEENCALVGGTWLQGIPCDPNPCEAVCCFIELTSPHGCDIMLEDECAAASGEWHPEWVTCSPNPCEIFTPAENTSWGAIKNMYR
jgi:hypothetical protein